MCKDNNYIYQYQIDIRICFVAYHLPDLKYPVARMLSAAINLAKSYRVGTWELSSVMHGTFSEIDRCDTSLSVSDFTQKCRIMSRKVAIGRPRVTWVRCSRVCYLCRKEGGVTFSKWRNRVMLSNNPHCFERFIKRVSKHLQEKNARNDAFG